MGLGNQTRFPINRFVIGKIVVEQRRPSFEEEATIFLTLRQRSALI
jgi:hypothetical protein